MRGKEGGIMKIVMINGSPKKSGFSSGSLDIISDYLTPKIKDIERINLADKDIGDCMGCYNCLKTGECVIKDDMGEIISLLKEADGIVVASPVRNGSVTSIFKGFFERICYPIGFPGDFGGKYVLAISSVGMASGKKENRRLLTFDGFEAVPVGFIWTKTGMPIKRTAIDIEKELKKGTDRLIQAIEKGKSPGFVLSLKNAINRFVMKKFLFSKAPDEFAYPIKRYREKGYM